MIYLKMCLYSLAENGVIIYQGIEEKNADEIALLLDEEAEYVSFVVSYLLYFGLAILDDIGNLVLLEVENMTGSESKSAEKMRRSREKTKLIDTKGSQCDQNVTLEIDNKNLDINIYKEIDRQSVSCVCEFMLRDGKKYCVTDELVSELKKAYPNANVNLELSLIHEWYTKKENLQLSKRSLETTIHNWLAEKQVGDVKKKTKKDNFTNFKQRDWDFATLEKMQNEERKFL